MTGKQDKQEQEHQEDAPATPSDEEIVKIIANLYAAIIKILKNYIDTSEEYFSIISIWIIGTYLHDLFSSYPYLFFNAMKGSGKSRTINLIVTLSYCGSLLADLTESVLFRTAAGTTIGIDEFENIASKEKTTLRTLLNGAYKKGSVVRRMVKVKNKWELEEFELYCAIVMANINGLDDVLSDRCITIIHEKSGDDRINRLIEDFENNAEIKKLKEIFEVNLVNLVQLVKSKNIISQWNEYVNLKSTDETTQTASSTLITSETTNLFEKIYNSDVKGRHLELFFPIFIIAWIIDEELLNKTINTTKDIVVVKKNDDLIESRDVALIGFISEMKPTLEFQSIKDITRLFREYMQDEDEQHNTINCRWVGRALKRLKLTAGSRRLAKGSEVILNAAKAKEKIKQFKIQDEKEKVS
jgi:hypothetical protein